ncbi:MAG: hypothetical protein A2086_11470 [Spirochaetes bacterium GWD1_27_9]|nr:MAG: hypothetical protein A2Z98_08490 [Spirochaetes bacterium GWB1_27_13]OHD36547.1 MAG: hypothetical protein A2086_11470 [Spirochaetes bacterium GWD1_27_9]
MSHKAHILGELPISNLMIKFIIPAFIGSFIFTTYNIVDRIFIGQFVGGIAIASLTIIFPMFIISSAIGMLIGIGGGALISIKLGEHHKEEAEKILGNAFFLFIIVGLIITILSSIFIDKILISLGASDSTFGYSKQYSSIIIYGIIFVFLSFGVNSLIRAEGNPKIAMKTMMISGISNLILDFLFIIVFKMSVTGAALATVLAMFISALWNLYHFTFSSKSNIKLKLKNLIPDFKIILRFLEIGLSPFLLQISNSIVIIFLNKILFKYGGDLAITSIGIINSILLFITMPIIAINQGSQPILGFNYGAKKYDRVKKTLLTAIVTGLIIATIGFTFVMAFPELILRLFVKEDKNLFEMATHGLRLVISLVILVYFQGICVNYFQSIGKAKISIFLNLLRQVILLLPLILILSSIFHLNGVLMAFPLSDLIATIVTSIFFIVEIRKLNSKHLASVKMEGIG